MKYRIYELSAMAMMRYAKEENGQTVFRLSEAAVKQCRVSSAPSFQEDCALFYQIICAMRDNRLAFSDDGDALKNALIYLDFTGIFNNPFGNTKLAGLQVQAKVMLTTGVFLDLGFGDENYVPFERSANMSGNSKISFIREDLYAPVKERIMLGMKLDECQLSKLYAYNGLMLTNGFRVEDMKIWDAKRVVVVDNPVSTVYEAPIITVEDDGGDDAMRKYKRIEKTADLEVTEFDGEGLISKEYAEYIDYLFCKQRVHTSFQIRMPYVKGVVHSIDLKNLFAELGVPYLIDIWGEKHDINDVDLILTKSMFKGYGWMTENGLSWREYLERCRKYDHALYVTGENQVGTRRFTPFNYQFLHTVAMTAEEFRPTDLPLGWETDPQNDSKYWLTKYTEAAYYRLVRDEEGRLEHFLWALNSPYADKRQRELAALLDKNPLFINEPEYTKELEDAAESIRKDYSLGRILVPGDVRYLSGDLVRFVQTLVKTVAYREDRYMGAVTRLEYECETGPVAYIPMTAYHDCETLTILRNPHIARNEEAVVLPPQNIGPLREKYFSHLSYVVMVDSKTLIPERLGGADFDGDLVKVIADPLLNACVRRNYTDNGYEPYGYKSCMPLLKIPAAAPQMRDANDKEACFEVIRNTFSSRVGHICNAAFNRSVVAYDENSDDAERKRLKEETELLEILTGLEIDSVKSGVKPELSQFLGKGRRENSPFLKYKSIIRDDGQARWNEKTQKQKLDAFFARYDWDSVTSNIERLPYLARMLKRNTPKLKAVPASDEALFTFAKKKNWKEKLNAGDMEYVRALIADYNEALARIRSNLYALEVGDGRRKDINRILFARGQDTDFTIEELYAVFSGMSAGEIDSRAEILKEQEWNFMPPAERESFLAWFLPYDTPRQYVDLFSDFRQNGYRLLIDVVYDLQAAYKNAEKKESRLHHADDSHTLRDFMNLYEKNDDRTGYQQLLGDACRREIHFGIGEERALKCAVALGNRQFAFDVLLDVMPQYAVKGRKRR